MENKLVFERLEQVFTLVKSHQREFPAQLMQVFLFICKKEGCHQLEIAQALGMSSSSVSRNVAWLSDKHRLGYAGLGLVYKKEGKESKLGHKYSHAYLTEKGKENARLIRKILYPHT